MDVFLSAAFDAETWAVIWFVLGFATGSACALAIVWLSRNSAGPIQVEEAYGDFPFMGEPR